MRARRITVMTSRIDDVPRDARPRRLLPWAGFLALAAPILLSGDVQAQTAPSARAMPVELPPTIDGTLDDPSWREGIVLDGFVQREPREGSPASQRTDVRVLQDGEALYIGAWLYDENAAGITLGQTLRDAPLQDADAFIVVLDTYLDRQNGFVFATTPAGIEYDGQVRGEGQAGGPGSGRQQAGSGAGFNLNWDGSWQVATSRDSAGWYAEIRVPFSTLRYGAGGPQSWGLNFERRIRRNNEEAVWAPVPRQFSVYRVSMAGTLALDAPSRRAVSVRPYVLGFAFRDYEAARPETELDQRVGGEAKIGLDQSLTLDLTVNTDFAQAEVDDQQVNLTRFSLFYPEKRAFFLENAGTFAVGASRSAELFFSRRIGLTAGREVPIRAGARLTGRLGETQIGLLNIQTGGVDEVDALTGAEVLRAPANNFGVLRGFRELGNRTGVGGIVVSRINTSDVDDYNLTYGVDGSLGLGQAVTVDGWAALTETPRAAAAGPATGFNGGEYGLEAGARYVTGDWQMSAGYRQIGAAFNPEVGFVNRRAYRHGNARILRHIRTSGISWFREFRPHVSWNQFWDLDGFSESYLVHIDNHFAFENGAFFQLPGFNFIGEGLQEPFEIREGIVIPAGSYHNIDWEFRANTNRGAPLSLSAGWGLGGFYTGTRFAPTATVAYRLQELLTLSLRAEWFDVRLDEGHFTTAVVGLNASYAFTPRTYLQLNVQYNDDTEDLGTNVRFGWLDTAGTGLFVVYNDARHMGTFVRTGIPSGPRQRQLVVKYSRLFALFD
jgi:hypothetical protein